MLAIPIRESDVVNVVARLAVAFPLRREQTVESVARVWFGVLGGLGTQELREALDLVLRDTSRKYLPTPAEFRTIVLQCRRYQMQDDPSSRYRRYERDPSVGACPVCSARLRLLSSEERGLDPGGRERYGVLHDPAAHQKAGVPHVGLPKRGFE